MRKNTFDIPGFLFVVVAGTILHFVYGWFGEAACVGYFAPVNESVWEHLKLLAIPALLWYACAIPLRGLDLFSYLPAVVSGVCAGCACILVLFYTYSGILGADYVVADVLIFVFAIYAVFRTVQKTAARGGYPLPTVVLSVVVLFLLLACFVQFTAHPPKLALFTPPIDGSRLF